MSLCPQNKRDEALGPRLRFNAYTIFVSLFLHVLCGIVFLMSQGHLSTGNSFIVFSTVVPASQRSFLKTAQTGKPGRKKQTTVKQKKVKKQKKRKQNKKVVQKQAPKKIKQKKKSFPEKPALKKKIKKGAVPEKVSEPVKEEHKETKAELPLIIEEPADHVEMVSAELEVVAHPEEAPEREEVVAHEEVPVETSEEEATSNEGAFDVVVGGDHGDYEGDAIAVSAQRYIPFVQREIYRLWHPPVGVAQGTVAVLKIAVNPSGGINDFDIVTPSGCLIFDMSIERIADKFAFDACLWGKTFTVEFRQ